VRLAKYRNPNGTVATGVLDGAVLRPLALTRAQGPHTIADLLAAPDPAALVYQLLNPAGTVAPLSAVTLLPPIDRQEVWAAGVTYLRSKTAREEESATAGGASFYDRVYTAPRPELFFKATADRVVGPGQPIRARADSHWTVPEPELALMISPDLRIVGYTIGNDVSARDIEGENPLYLPQAKVYRQSCALGPCVTLAAALPPRGSVRIRLTVQRGDAIAFEGETGLDRMARPLEELVEWLGRENEFPNGVILLTGTGVVPPDDFTLLAGDVVSISIDGIGTLTNPVVVGA
jgi:2-dehydro-3-deoxy-D-arabinonate dehydratase